MRITARVSLPGAGPEGEEIKPGTTFDFPDEKEARSLVARGFAAAAASESIDHEELERPAAAEVVTAPPQVAEPEKAHRKKN